MVGSTSYLHVHVPLYIDAILQQHNSYHQYLTEKFISKEVIRGWLSEGLLAARNVSAKTHWRNYTSDVQLLMAALETNSAVYYEIGQLHQKDLKDIKDTIGALKNMMPQIEERPFTPTRHDRSLSPNAYVVAGYSDDGTCDDGPDCIVVPVPAFRPDEADSTDREQPQSWTTTTTTTSTTSRPKSTKNIKYGVAQMGESYRTLKLETNDPWERFNNVHNVAGRHKRFVLGAVALPIAVAATAMGLYNRAQIAALQEELFDVKANTRRLFSITQNMTKGMIAMNKNINEIRTTIVALVATNPTIIDARMTRIENQLRHRIMRTTHAVQSAIHGRLAVDYLNPEHLNQLFGEIKTRATELGCDLLIQYHTDLFQVEASLLFDGADAHVLVHVPMAPKEGQLRLFRLHPFPLPLFEDRYLIPDVKTDVLAISSTSNRLNIQLAAVDLLSCHRINQIFMCDSFGVLSKRLNNTCLGALYFSMFSEAQKICKFKVVPAEEQAYQIRKGEFVVYLPQASTINILCRNGTHAELHLRKGSQTVHISKGCQGELHQHRLISDYSETFGTEIKIFEWNWDSTNFLEGSGEFLQKAIQQLEDIQILHPDLSELRYLASVPDHSGTPGYFGYILTFVCVCCLILGLCVCTIVCVRKSPCTQPSSAAERRGQARSRRRAASCGLLCCCRGTDDVIESKAQWTRAAGSDTDDVAFEFPPPRKGPTSRLNNDLIKANKLLEKRLSTLEKQHRLSRVYDN